MVVPFRVVATQRPGHSEGFANLPRHRQTRSVDELPTHTGRIEEKDGIVAGCIDRVFPRRIRDGNLLLQQELLVEPIAAVRLRRTERVFCILPCSTFATGRSSTSPRPEDPAGSDEAAVPSRTASGTPWLCFSRGGKFVPSSQRLVCRVGYLPSLNSGLARTHRGAETPGSRIALVARGGGWRLAARKRSMVVFP